MPRRRRHARLAVFLNTRPVGLLQRQASGAVYFQYDARWLEWDGAMPVSYSMPLREDRYTGNQVVAVFDNLLPDNVDTRRHLAERTHAGGDDAISLLSAIGRDCVGALQFLPEGEEPDPPGALKSRPVDDNEISRILSNLNRFPLGVSEADDFRISIAGAQEKTALLRLDGKWRIPNGTTPTTHIVKPQIGFVGGILDLSRSVENQHFCMSLIGALGLPVAKTEVADFGEKRALVVERFDRRWTKDNRLLRLPQEDCCQALSVPSGRKYQSDGGPGIAELAALLKASDTPDDDVRLLLKAQVVFWLLGATDGHAKNFSIHLFPAGRFRMTPLYDVMSVQPAVDAGQIGKNQMRLAMSVGTTRHYTVNTVAPRHFIETAKMCGVPENAMREILDDLAGNATSALETVTDQLPSDFPMEIADAIAGGVLERLRVIGPASSGA